MALVANRLWSDFAPSASPNSLSSDSSYSHAIWNPPTQRFFKVNCDASLRDDGSGGIGCIVRDDRGRFLVACAKRVTSSLEVDHLEGLAAEMGAVMLKNLGCSRVIIEGDCDAVYRRLNSNTGL